MTWKFAALLTLCVFWGSLVLAEELETIPGAFEIRLFKPKFPLEVNPAQPTPGPLSISGSWGNLDAKDVKHRVKVDEIQFAQGGFQIRGVHLGATANLSGNFKGRNPIPNKVSFEGGKIKMGNEEIVRPFSHDNLSADIHSTKDIVIPFPDKIVLLLVVDGRTGEQRLTISDKERKAVQDHFNQKIDEKLGEKGFGNYFGGPKWGNPPRVKGAGPLDGPLNAIVDSTVLPALADRIRGPVSKALCDSVKSEIVKPEFLDRPLRDLTKALPELPLRRGKTIELELKKETIKIGTEETTLLRLVLAKPTHSFSKNVESAVVPDLKKSSNPGVVLIHTATLNYLFQSYMANLEETEDKSRLPGGFTADRSRHQLIYTANGKEESTLLAEFFHQYNPKIKDSSGLAVGISSSGELAPKARLSYLIDEKGNKVGNSIDMLVTFFVHPSASKLEGAGERVKLILSFEVGNDGTIEFTDFYPVEGVKQDKNIDAISMRTLAAKMKLLALVPLLKFQIRQISVKETQKAITSLGVTQLRLLGDFKSGSIPRAEALVVDFSLN